MVEYEEVYIKNQIEILLEIAGEQDINHHLKGFEYRPRDLQEKVNLTLDAGTVLKMVPEPDNPHDPNAIKLLFGEDFIGYVPSSWAKSAKEYPIKQVRVTKNSKSRGITDWKRKKRDRVISMVDSSGKRLNGRLYTWFVSKIGHYLDKGGYDHLKEERYDQLIIEGGEVLPQSGENLLLPQYQYTLSKRGLTLEMCMNCKWFDSFGWIEKISDAEAGNCCRNRIGKRFRPDRYIKSMDDTCRHFELGLDGINKDKKWMIVLRKGKKNFWKRHPDLRATK